MPLYEFFKSKSDVASPMHRRNNLGSLPISLKNIYSNNSYKSLQKLMKLLSNMDEDNTDSI